MNVKPTLGQTANTFVKTNPIVAGLIGLAAIVGIGIGIASRNKSKSSI